MIGQTLNDRFEIIARLGKGAMGEVFRATDRQTGETVAVKVLSGDLAMEPDMIERFRREGEALRQLRHPNIVGLVDTFMHAGGQVIVMDFVPGGSLHDLLRRDGPLPVERARRMALDLCDALIRAHRLDIIHRDIKPENILIAQDGTPRLTDFGVARLVGGSTRLTGTGTQVGTPYYMAPEAWEGQAVDAQADVWSLGVALHEMLAGQVPFGGETMASVMNKVLTTPPPDLKNLRPEVPDGIARVVARMLTRDKAARYSTVREASADLERGGVSALAPAPGAIAARGTKTGAARRVWMRRFWARASAVVVGMSLFSTFGLWWTAGDAGALSFYVGLTLMPATAESAGVSRDDPQAPGVLLNRLSFLVDAAENAPLPFNLMTPFAQTMLAEAQAELAEAQAEYARGNFEATQERSEAGLRSLSPVFRVEWGTRLAAMAVTLAVVLAVAGKVAARLAPATERT